jgi:hypothetical protein
MRAIGGQGREAAGGKGTQERVELLPGRGIAQALLGGRRGIGQGEADGVVVNESEGHGRLGARQPGHAQRREECLGQCQRCRADGVARLEQGGDAGMAVQDVPQPTGEGRDLRDPRCAGVGLAVDLGEHRVEGEVV